MILLNNTPPLFQVVVSCGLLQHTSVDIAVRAFSKFFFGLTPKHHRRVKFILLDAASDFQQVLIKKNQEVGLDEPIFIAEKSNSNNLQRLLAGQNNLVFHPDHKSSDSIRIALISMRAPILTFQSWEKAYGFESVAAIYLPNDAEGQAIREFSNLIKIVYHDPGAFNMLRNKALRHRRSEVAMQMA